MFFVHSNSTRYSFLKVILPFLLIVLLWRAFPVEAEPALQTGLETNLDGYLTDHMARLKIPGAAVGIVRGDQVILLKGYGTADAGRTQPVTPQTPFYLASVSKSFTARGIMQLVEAGKLELDTPVREILPWFQGQGAGAETMTVRHLLHQTSGLSERGGYSRNLEPDGLTALETSIRHLADDTLQRVPGTDYEYSNTNFDVLGLIIETVSGQAYGEWFLSLFRPCRPLHAVDALYPRGAPVGGVDRRCGRHDPLCARSVERGPLSGGPNPVRGGDRDLAHAGCLVGE
jgi:CubicO group peptidase (beta-lactamase class C family)